MFESYGEDARRASNLAFELAQRAGDGFLDDIHLLYGCARAEGSLAAQLLRALSIDRERVAAWAEERAASLGPGSGKQGVTSTQREMEALQFAMDAALDLRHEWLGSHHFLFGLLRAGREVARELEKLGATVADARRALIEIHAAAPAATVAARPNPHWNEIQLLRIAHTHCVQLQELALANGLQDLIDALERRLSRRAPITMPLAFRGRVETPIYESVHLRGNRAGDPHVREVPVYLPPQASDTNARFPVVFLLSGFTGNGRDFLETHPWKFGLVAQFDRAVASGACPPAILVMPDCFTKYGGSQYVSSGYLGAYAGYVASELVAFVDDRYPTLRGRRAIVGKSSGGFGAMHLSMRHPEVFPVAVSISGDVGFEYCYAPSFLACLRTLVAYDGDPAKFLAAFWSKPELTNEAHDALNALAMSACYSPNQKAPLGFDLPFDLRTGARIESVWKRWLEFDPLFACERYADNWKKLELLHLECGLRDEWNLQWSLRQLVDKLRALGVPHVHEEHEGTHRNLNHRYLAVLLKVIETLARRA